jgi:hypothetical protein
VYQDLEFLFKQFFDGVNEMEWIEKGKTDNLQCDQGFITTFNMKSLSLKQ